MVEAMHYWTLVSTYRDGAERELIERCLRNGAPGWGEGEGDMGPGQGQGGEQEGGPGHPVQLYSHHTLKQRVG